jgi:uncharacterized protein
MNELSKETSPYLLQHKNNPIHWKAWNSETLKSAINQNKLIVVSIGYSACHWCHVMEHECFEDDDVAIVMNNSYISIKVDREERPDIDAIYMKALQLMTRQGGWPLNVVCLPDGRPIWGATYVNKESWIESLEQLQELFETQYDKVLDYAQKLQLGISDLGLVKIEKESDLSLDNITPLINNWKRSFDWEYGGPARAPKFMMPTNLNFLQNYGSITNDQELIDYVDITLTRMAQGGLFDVVDGGFSRYSVDIRWHIPHFEKMLYDNGQLLQTYATAYKRTHNSYYKEICYKTIDFITENWLTHAGLVYSAYDADSIDSNQKLQEGAFYYWTKDELKQLLLEDYNWFKTLYNVNDFGFWEHDFYVFIQTQSLSQVAEQVNLTTEILKEKNTQALKKLKEYRSNNRKLPRLDDKCLTSWNAIWVIGMLECYEAFNDRKHLDLATKTMDAITNLMLDHETGILYRNYKDEKTTISGFLDDYAFTIKALIKLYQNTLKIEYIKLAKQITDYCLDHFYEDQVGLFQFKNKSDDQLIAKHYEIEDNVIPSANAIMGQNLWLLQLIYENKHYKEICSNMLKTVLPSIDYASVFSDWLQLLLWMQDDYQHIIFTGTNALELVKTDLTKHQYNSNVFGCATENELAIFKNKFVLNNNQKFICTNTHCINQNIL